MTPVEQFRHLIAMAAADGRMDENELRMLSNRALQLGVTDDEFEDVLHTAITHREQLSIPSDHRDRVALLQDLLRMMAADGRLDQREKSLFAIVAATMQISPNELNLIIDTVLAEAGEL
jgi:uncharacterized tellurite resistance protein B-like protein